MGGGNEGKGVGHHFCHEMFGCEIDVSSLLPGFCGLRVAGPTFPWALTSPRSSPRGRTKWPPASSGRPRRTPRRGPSRQVRAGSPVGRGGPGEPPRPVAGWRATFGVIMVRPRRLRAGGKTGTEPGDVLGVPGWGGGSEEGVTSDWCIRCLCQILEPPLTLANTVCSFCIRRPA